MGSESSSHRASRAAAVAFGLSAAGLAVFGATQVPQMLNPPTVVSVCRQVDRAVVDCHYPDGEETQPSVVFTASGAGAIVSAEVSAHFLPVKKRRTSRRQDGFDPALGIGE